MKPGLFLGGCDVICDQGLFAHEDCWVHLVIKNGIQVMPKSDFS